MNVRSGADKREIRKGTETGTGDTDRGVGIAGSVLDRGPRIVENVSGAPRPRRDAALAGENLPFTGTYRLQVLNTLPLCR